MGQVSARMNKTLTLMKVRCENNACYIFSVESLAEFADLSDTE